MKKQTAWVLLILISCAQEPSHLMRNCSEKPESVMEQWKLVKMTGNVANMPPMTGDAMSWQESYLLYPDATFKKIRERDNVVREEIGTYAYVTSSDGAYLELVYPSDNALIGNCISEPKELLRVNSSTELVGTWWACDGPGLFYEKVEYDCDEH